MRYVKINRGTLADETAATLGLITGELVDGATSLISNLYNSTKTKIHRNKVLEKWHPLSQEIRLIGTAVEGEMISVVRGVGNFLEEAELQILDQAKKNNCHTICMVKTTPMYTNEGIIFFIEGTLVMSEEDTIAFQKVRDEKKKIAQHEHEIQQKALNEFINNPENSIENFTKTNNMIVRRKYSETKYLLGYSNSPIDQVFEFINGEWVTTP